MTRGFGISPDTRGFATAQPPFRGQVFKRRQGARPMSAFPSRRLPATLLAAATIAASVFAGPAAADYMKVVEFRAATPKCEANPGLPWIGRASGQTQALMSDFEVPVSFVGCFRTEAECRKWLGHGIGLITGRVVENSCRPR